jgi:hypothetical protein
MPCLRYDLFLPVSRLHPYWVSKTLFTGLELGVFEALSEMPTRHGSWQRRSTYPTTA